MTQAELDALPDVTPRFGTREEVRDGQRYTIPVQTAIPDFELVFEPDDEAPIWVVDHHGVVWYIGRTRDGKMAKRQAP